MAAFGALPAMIDEWAPPRGKTTFSSMASGQLLVRSSSDVEDELPGVPLRVCREVVLPGLGALQAVRALQVLEADGGFRAPSGMLALGGL